MGLYNTDKEVVDAINNLATEPSIEGIKRIFSVDNVHVSVWNGVGDLCATIENNFAWFSSNKIWLSTNGLGGEKTEIDFNDTNFPDLIPNSTIQHIIMMPWTRGLNSNINPTQYARNWRMNIITNRGQIYHNFPSRGIDKDGSYVEGDELRFEESCIWELEGRKTPVATESGMDAELIATGLYKYFPGLPEESYEFHPPLNKDNGYGNGGYGATQDFYRNSATTKKFSRFWRPKFDFTNNSVTFMGGWAPDHKLSTLATYNTPNARMCVFATSDGGRNWFVKYEFGEGAAVYDSEGTILSDGLKTSDIELNHIGSYTPANMKVKNRTLIIPSAANKEPSDIFRLGTDVEVSSIVDSVVTTAVDHNLKDGETVIFTSSENNGTFEYLINNNHTNKDAGNGNIFIAKVLSSTTFKIVIAVHNPHNNLTCHHIHSLNRCKDGVMIGTGETYPTAGWIIWMPITESDAHYKVMGSFPRTFIRLNSTANSAMRPLGVELLQDVDNTFYIGVDNEHSYTAPALLPEGRTESLRRSSNGLFRGKLANFDDNSQLVCALESREVCYFFKRINGVYVWIGQLGHIGISLDGETFYEGRIPAVYLNFLWLSRYGGQAYDNTIVIGNIIIKIS